MGDTFKCELKGVAKQTAERTCQLPFEIFAHWVDTYVKSPVASLCFVCSSVRNLVSVTMSVLIDSEPTAPGSLPLPLPLIWTSVGWTGECG